MLPLETANSLGTIRRARIASVTTGPPGASSASPDPASRATARSLQGLDLNALEPGSNSILARIHRLVEPSPGSAKIEVSVQAVHAPSPWRRGPRESWMNEPSRVRRSSSEMPNQAGGVVWASPASARSRVPDLGWQARRCGPQAPRCARRCGASLTRRLDPADAAPRHLAQGAACLPPAQPALVRSIAGRTDVALPPAQTWLVREG